VRKGNSPSSRAAHDTTSMCRCWVCVLRRVGAWRRQLDIAGDPVPGHPLPEPAVLIGSAASGRRHQPGYGAAPRTALTSRSRSGCRAPSANGLAAVALVARVALLEGHEEWSLGDAVLALGVAHRGVTDVVGGPLAGSARCGASADWRRSHPMRPAVPLHVPLYHAAPCRLRWPGGGRGRAARIGPAALAPRRIRRCRR
jgi:hypothetical protein